MKDVDWELYRLFLAVAREGGLSGAAAKTGLSSATLGRRMVELEQRTGRSLFRRSQKGYGLTGEGRRFLDLLRPMEAAARDIGRWRSELPAPALVRLACGSWMAWLIAENYGAIVAPEDDVRLEMTIGERRAALAHRENDIGIRAFEPDEPNLASRPAGSVAYAAYRARNLAAVPDERFVAVHPENALSAYLRWPHENRPSAVVATVDQARALRDLALAGAGIAVLPCFVGDLEPRLTRHGGEIEDLRHRQWIVVHSDDRHRPEIRKVADRLYGLLRSHRDLIEGRRPSRS